jgi:hypothetical protein
MQGQKESSVLLRNVVKPEDVDDSGDGIAKRSRERRSLHERKPKD